MAMLPGLSSQPLLAKKAGLSQSTIGRIIRGEVNPSAENLKRIADAFGFEVGSLFIEHDMIANLVDARRRGLEQRFVNATEVSSVSVMGDLEFDAMNEKFTLSLKEGRGSVIGVEVDDGYALRMMGDVPGVHSHQYLVLERTGLPAFSDLCILESVDGTLGLYEYLHEQGESYSLEEAGTRYRTTIPQQDVKYIHGVVAVLSSRQWRP